MPCAVKTSPPKRQIGMFEHPKQEGLSHRHQALSIGYGYCRIVYPHKLQYPFRVLGLLCCMDLRLQLCLCSNLLLGPTQQLQTNSIRFPRPSNHKNPWQVTIRACSKACSASRLLAPSSTANTLPEVSETATSKTNEPANSQ